LTLSICVGTRLLPGQRFPLCRCKSAIANIQSFVLCLPPQTESTHAFAHPWPEGEPDRQHKGSARRSLPGCSAGPGQRVKHALRAYRVHAIETAYCRWLEKHRHCVSNQQRASTIRSQS